MSEPATTTPLEGIIVGANADATQLVTVQSRPVVEIFTTPGLVPALLAAVKAEAAKGFTPDVTTAKGREAIKAQAFKVTKTKTYLEDMGKKEAARLKALVKPLDEGRKALWDGLERLQSEVRKPLTDWEERRDVLQKRMAIIQNEPTTMAMSDAIGIQSSIDTVEAMNPDEFDEFSVEAAGIKAVTLVALRKLLEDRKKWEADQADLARLRKEEADRKSEAEREALRIEGEARAARALQTPNNPPLLGLAATLGVVVDPSVPAGTAIVQQDGREVARVINIGVGDGRSTAFPAPVTQAATDVEHRRAFNREAMADLQAAIVTADTETGQTGDPRLAEIAKAVLTAIVTGKVRHITITY